MDTGLLLGIGRKLSCRSYSMMISLRSVYFIGRLRSRGRGLGVRTAWDYYFSREEYNQSTKWSCLRSCERKYARQREVVTVRTWMVR